MGWKASRWRWRARARARRVASVVSRVLGVLRASAQAALIRWVRDVWVMGGSNGVGGAVVVISVGEIDGIVKVGGLIPWIGP